MICTTKLLKQNPPSRADFLLCTAEKEEDDKGKYHEKHGGDYAGWRISTPRHSILLIVICGSHNPILTYWN